MNPNQLDPKLKETYERVMGTSLKPSQRSAPFVPKPVSPIPIAQPVTPQPTVLPQPFQPIQAKPVQPIQQSQPQPIQAPMAKPQAQAGQKPQTQNAKKKNKMLPILIVLGGILFLLGYTFLWIKLFRLKLPFLPF